MDRGSIPRTPVTFLYGLYFVFSGEIMDINVKRFLTAVSILVGTCIGAGVLGIPYVASQSGFLIALLYIFFVGGIILLINLYLGEVSLRTKSNHQISGYARKYLGIRGKKLMEFAVIFGIYSAIIAYLFGVGESLSFLILGNTGYSVVFGVFFGIFMSVLLWSGLSSLKRFERIGVAIILFLLIAIFGIFIGRVDLGNLIYVNWDNLFLPFGVILFALISFHAVPQITFVIKDKSKIKKAILSGTGISILFYILFAFVVVGFKGSETPEIATFALGSIFVLLGILTMFTSYLSLGNALEEDFLFDDHFKKKKSWMLSSLIPIIIYIVVSFFDFFSFTKILSIGGVVSGGLITILVLVMAKKAKLNGDRKPEYSIPLNWVVIIFISLIFILGVVREIFLVLK